MSKLAHSNQETMDLIEAHRLGQHAEVASAMAQEAAAQRRKGFGRTWHDYYDPLAETCLGDLIHQRMTKRRGG